MASINDDTVHMLEIESGDFFNMDFLEEAVMNGKWNELEIYLLRFTGVFDNRFSTETFFLIRKTNFIEALDRHDNQKAVEILRNDLKIFAKYCDNFFKDFTMLLTLDDIREHKCFNGYVDANSNRALVLVSLKQFIQENPLFEDKLLSSNTLHQLQHTGWQFDLFNWNKDCQSLLDPAKSDIERIMEPSQLRSLRLPDSLSANNIPIMRLLYTNSGDSVLALCDNACHKLWRWKGTESNVAGKASADEMPEGIPSGGIMINLASNINPTEADPCFALSDGFAFLMSASGGEISVFNMKSLERMYRFMPPPPTATYIAFHPKKNSILAIGMDDSTIWIYNVPGRKCLSKLQGHCKKVTGLAFSMVLGVLVSSDADSQLCVWSIDNWEKRISKFLEMPTRETYNPCSHTRIQFHKDGIHLLAVHETQVAVYEAPTMEAFKQWLTRRGSSNEITDAVYSGGCQMIYVSFKDCRVGVLTAETLTLRCLITPAAYMLSNPRRRVVYPLVIAANPTEPNQFALGLSDGVVHVFEPLKSKAKWFTLPSDDGAGPSTSSGVGFFDDLIGLDFTEDSYFF